MLQQQQQQPTLDQLAACLPIQAVVPSAASALKQRQLNVSTTAKSSAWEAAHWVQTALQLSSQPYAPTLGLVGYAVLAQHLLEQQVQVGQQLHGCFCSSGNRPACYGSSSRLAYCRRSSSKLASSTLYCSNSSKSSRLCCSGINRSSRCRSGSRFKP